MLCQLFYSCPATAHPLGSFFLPRCLGEAAGTAQLDFVGSGSVLGREGRQVTLENPRDEKVMLPKTPPRHTKHIQKLPGGDSQGIVQCSAIFLLGIKMATWLVTVSCSLLEAASRSSGCF